MSQMHTIDKDAFLKAFEENFALHGDLGAAAAVWSSDGECLISCAGGFADRAKTQPWQKETPVLFWSGTKGLASATLLRVMEDHDVAPSRCVAEFWPEFAQGGKESVTISQLVSHQAGLCAVESSELSILDHEGCAVALAGQTPYWKPGMAHGYHVRTFGILVEELIRRIEPGSTLQSRWRESFAEPMGLDIWIGMPEEKQGDVAEMMMPRAGSGNAEERLYRALSDSESLSRKAFTRPGDLRTASSMNTVRSRSASLPSLGGIGTADSLARFFAMLAGDGSWLGARYFKPESLDYLRKTVTQGPDLVLCTETAFSFGMMKDPDRCGVKTREVFGRSLAAFGHPGAGGSHLLADPERGLGFAYVMNQMELGVLPNHKSMALVQALFAPGSEP